MIRKLSKFYFCEPEDFRDTPAAVLIGAYHRGQELPRLIEINPDIKIFIYEAEPSIFNRVASHLIDDVASGKLPAEAKITLVNAAIADSIKPVAIYKYKQEEASSMIEVKGKPIEAKTTVNGVTLRAILDQHKLDKVDYLLMNCEGGELYAISQLLAQPDLPNKFPQICTSFHCDHVHLYPKEVKDSLLDGLADIYRTTLGSEKKVQHYLFRLKV